MKPKIYQHPYGYGSKDEIVNHKHNFNKHCGMQEINAQHH
jgi:hypothetical protein